MNRRDFLGLSRAGLVCAPLLIKELLKEPHDENAVAELVVKDGTVLENSHIEGVTIKAIGDGKVLIQNLNMKARRGQRAAIHIDHDIRLSGHDLT